MRLPTEPPKNAIGRNTAESTVATPIAAAQMDTFVAESLRVPARVWKATFREFLDVDFSAELPGIAAPTLVVSGGKDPLSRAQERHAMLGAIRGATALEYPELGHAVHWERPAAIAVCATCPSPASITTVTSAGFGGRQENAPWSSVFPR